MKNKQTVLIIDDIVDNLNVVANILIRENINVFLAQSGKEALDIVGKHLPDLILLDIMMPEMNGFEVLSQLKSNNLTKEIPVIFFTAIGEVKNIVKGFKHGVVDYITKPFHSEEVLARVQTHLTISLMRKEKEEVNIILEQQVNERTTQLQETNKELKYEIEERKVIENELKRNNKKLKQAKAKAEESDRLKTAFLNNISHEIRTPMNGIIGFASLLNIYDLSSEKRKSYTDTIIESSNQLMTIVSDILAISKIHSGQVKIAKNNLEVNSLISDVINDFKSKAEAKNISINKKQNLDDTSLKVYTDGVKLQQILIKLIDNAIKYTQKGRIECGYSIKKENIEFYIKDTGIGISTEMHNKIFEQFRQVAQKLTSNLGGTGLGLTIAKAYINLLGGKIWLKSELNKGSVFYFTTPYMPVYDINDSSSGKNNKNAS